MEVGNSEKVYERLASDAADLGFVEGPRAKVGFRHLAVARDELVLVVPPSHPWARRTAPLSAAELAGARLLVREPGSGTRQTAERALAGHTAGARQEVGSNAALIAGIVAGLGPGIVSRLAVAQELTAGRLIVIDLEGQLRMTRVLRACWPATSAPEGTAAKFLRMLRPTTRRA